VEQMIQDYRTTGYSTVTSLLCYHCVHAVTVRLQLHALWCDSSFFEKLFTSLPWESKILFQTCQAC